ncbi:MAG: DNA photolyase family protein [Gammaproteobacteria bacterium]|nr:DNA photolyase family protein [Gammaproteobacteria bacterium]MDH4314871.1 DNA photolyase family protein [Gammaproteobacteria bacterium]MDH5213783.1 DNA photolyase family protein [Gammaproteobacteria bacterium]MDH5499846.1 DNA photolyase family protein [Gammaproteobacteria bacterium]
MASQKPVILWFRQDLRIADNPALNAAHACGAPVLPIFVQDDVNAGDWAPGGASRWWLHQSLSALNSEMGGHLQFFRGDPNDIVPGIAAETDADIVFWNRCYEPWQRARDEKLRDSLRASGKSARTFNASLLFEPPEISKADRTPYRVFTPFYKKGCLENGPRPREAEQAPDDVRWHQHSGNTTLDDLGLEPKVRWYDEMQNTWTPGERGARERLATFLKNGLKGYKEGRNFPDRKNVSRLSPHLHFGEISPQQVWRALDEQQRSDFPVEDIEHFRSELAWREFSYNLLYHFPDLPSENLQRKFNRFPWREDAAALRAWQRGETGYPIVDAGMRELWRTGYMHNRVRMIVGSFLVKNLLLHWHHGERWFWDTLVDADLANNSASWQWIAGCGADAAPYFRIFNPLTQGRKFDPDGAYVRRYVPELAAMPDKFLHAPWEASEEIRRAANVTLGQTYPDPIVDLAESRERALAAFRSLSSG